MTDPALHCPSTYGVLICQFPHGILRQVLPHSATLASGRRVTWGADCDATCTADCAWCKGELRRAKEVSGQ